MVRNRLIFDQAMEKANTFAWDARWEDAAREYERALAEFPDQVLVRLNLGMAYLELGRIAHALEQYTEAHALDPKDPLPLSKIAHIQEKTGEKRQAAETYIQLAKVWASKKAATQELSAWQKVASLMPSSVQAHVQMAKAYVRNNRPDKAVEEYLAAALAARDQGDIEQAVQHCENALALDPYHNTARSLREDLSLGNSLKRVKSDVSQAERGQSPIATAVQRSLSRLAERIFAVQKRQAVSHDLASFDQEDVESRRDVPQTVTGQQIGTLISRAIDYQSRGVLDKAIDTYRRIQSLGADDPDMRFNLGVLHYKAMSYDKAIDYLQESTQIPDYALASLFALGQCYRAEDRLEEALESYLKLLYSLDAKKGQASGETLLQLYSSLVGSQGRIKNRERAVAFLDAITSFMTGEGWENRLLKVHQQIENLAKEDVVVSLADIVEVPGSDQVLEGLQRSQRYLEQGYTMAAIEEGYHILDIAPSYLPIHTHLAEVFVQQGKIDQAVSKYAVIANTYQIRGDTKQAIRTYRRIQELDPLDVIMRPRLISLLTSRGQIDEALQEYMALADAYYQRAQVEKTLEKYQEALALAPRGSTDHLWPVAIRKKMVGLYSQRLDWGLATRIYQDIKRIRPLSPQEYGELVDLYYKAGQKRRAESELEEMVAKLGEGQLAIALQVLRDLIERRPTETGLRMRATQLLLKAGDKEGAIAQLDALGESQLEQGDTSAAIGTIEQIIALRPSHLTAYHELLQQLKQQDRSDGA